MNITINHDRCVGSGMCVMHAPGIFAQRESDGHAVVLRTDPTKEEIELVYNAVNACPMHAIEVNAKESTAGAAVNNPI